ncbi:hypothetical protein YTPLAS18_10540 [Nitrospira sp.]|nr:hypothetical protein YTPLAS18_10540 [Nitrospira sp.]
MGPVIQEFLLCLLPAAAIGSVVGWMLKQMSMEEQEVGITRFELEVKLTAAERKLLSLQRELEIAQQSMQDKTSEASIAAEELGQMRSQLADRDELVRGLRTRLSSFESLPVKLATHEATIADLRARLVALEELPEILKERESEVALLRAQLGDMVPKAHGEKERSELRERITSLEAQLAEAKSVAEQEETWARQVLGERDGTIQHLHDELARLQRTIGEVTALKANLFDREGTILQLRQELDQVQAMVAERDALQERIRAQQADMARVNGLLADAEHRAEALREEIAVQEATIGQLEEVRAAKAQVEARLVHREEQLERLKSKIKESEKGNNSTKSPVKPKRSKDTAGLFDAELAPAMPKWGADAPDAQHQDDLKKITGVGPTLERLLHKQGIFYFRQIASWTKDDIQVIDRKLDTFKGRIVRDNWIKGAKDEHYRKYGERL